MCQIGHDPRIVGIVFNDQQDRLARDDIVAIIGHQVRDRCAVKHVASPEPGYFPWPEQSLAYDAALDQTYTYDPARARQLLNAAGWDPATVIPLSVPNGSWRALQPLAD